MKLLTVWIPNGDELHGRLEVLDTLYQFNEFLQIIVTTDNKDQFVEDNPLIDKFDLSKFTSERSLRRIKPHIKGLYFKIIYGQDLLNFNSFQTLVETIDSFIRAQHAIDLFITDYSIRNNEKIAVVNYRHTFKLDKITTWHDTTGLAKTYIPFAALTFKSALLCKDDFHNPLNLDADNILITLLAFVQSDKIYYLDECVYNHSDTNIMSFDSIMIFNQKGSPADYPKYLIEISNFNLGRIKSRKLKNYLMNQYLMVLVAHLMKIKKQAPRSNIQAIRYHIIGAISNYELQNFLNNRSSRKLLDSLTSTHQLAISIRDRKVKKYFQFAMGEILK